MRVGGAASAGALGFENVLYCPLSDRGGTAAIRRIANVMASGADLVVAAVVPEPTRLQNALHTNSFVEGALATGRRSLRRRVDRCVAAVPDDVDVDVSAVVEIGHPVLSVLSRVIAARHDLLVLSVGDETDPHETALVQRFFRRSQCPVWIIRPTRSTSVRVLAAADVDEGAEDINAEIVRTAQTLAGPDGELHLVTAWELYGESTMRSSAFVQVDPNDVARMRAGVGASHRTAAVDLVASHAAEPGRWSIHVDHGPAGDVIRRAVVRHHITTLVIGTVARTGVGALVMGNTAERVTDLVSCSVVAVKPPRSRSSDV